MCSFHESAVVGTYIFGFVLPNLISVAIFVENRAFLNFGGVGYVGSLRSSCPSTLQNPTSLWMMSYERQWPIVCKIIVRCVSFYFMKPLPLPCQKYGKKWLKWGLCAFLSLLLIWYAKSVHSSQLANIFKSLVLLNVVSDGPIIEKLVSSECFSSRCI